MTEWKKTQGTQDSAPFLIDVESSPTTVYERRNVRKMEDEEGNSYWEYEEREFTKDEYILRQSSQMVSKEDNLINQAALADIYELILEMGGAE